jgi:hypothetical protein
LHGGSFPFPQGPSVLFLFIEEGVTPHIETRRPPAVLNGVRRYLQISDEPVLEIVSAIITQTHPLPGF